jgi:hypothetical protein
VPGISSSSDVIIGILPPPAAKRSIEGEIPNFALTSPLRSSSRALHRHARNHRSPAVHPDGHDPTAKGSAVQQHPAPDARFRILEGRGMLEDWPPDG